MISSLISRLIILFFGTLYPAYASYKAVRTKNVKEYVKWMMYWIVFAFFTCIETFTDIFLAWFPFYYEIKVVIVLWLLSPATKGSSTLYRKFVHPMLTRREQEIDEYLNQARERGYSAVLQLGSKGVNYATNVIMQTAIKGGGNLVQTIKRSYSLSDLSEPDMHRTQDELDEVMASSTVMLRPQPTRLMRQRHQTPVGRSASGTRHSTGMYFTEVDVAGAGKQSGDFNYNIRSTDDISSGYSSAEPVSAPLGNVGVGLSRTSSMTNASKARVKSKRSEQLLEDMRAEVYLENERYFQACRAEMLRQQMPLKIDESEQEQLDSNDDNEFDDDDEDEEQTFYEALASKDSSLEPEQKVEQLSDNEDSFKEALTTASTELTLKEEHVEEAATEDAPKAEQIEEQAAAAKEQELEEKADFNALTATMDPFLLVMTETRPAARPVSPRQLLATLEDIQHSFRAQLQPEMPLPRPKAQHSKGPAPPPPLPPKKERRTPERSAQQTERSRSSGIGQLFKSFKDNVRRGSSSSKDEQLPTTAAKETPI
ncbi:uncharacterized protein LOC108597154 isoform X2 [Drosophila busckii]|uniref:uncharacterized protein LOC108597154 isoform X2 n=1 Tax=Drosophila busckii TaxID=30019 RepID=UPI00083EC507|nr:uncharacterized protein LOC108597154 isoform X2 [Drosophila busckii]XP_017839046.1 uncharacterized protein LOC108597154 isoform X2 [Drosophila busckii]